MARAPEEWTSGPIHVLPGTADDLPSHLHYAAQHGIRRTYLTTPTRLSRNDDGSQPSALAARSNLVCIGAAAASRDWVWTCAPEPPRPSAPLPSNYVQRIHQITNLCP